MSGWCRAAAGTGRGQQAVVLRLTCARLGRKV